MSSHSEVFATTDSSEADLVDGAKKVAFASAGVLLAIVLGLIILVSFVSPQEKENPNMSAQAVAERIQKVGAAALADNTPHEPKSGEQVFNVQCSSCHASGALGSPKFGDKAAWGPRIATGFASLWNSALHGKNAMPAQGGGPLSDFEVARGVTYMANAGGAKFPEPKEDAKPAK